jgi:hypothetical protein
LDMLAAMISVEGAKLLAALIPVLVLILAVERRALGPEQRPVYVIGWVWFCAKLAGQTVGAGMSIVMLGPLVIAVNANAPLDGVWAVATIASVILAGFGVVSIVVPLVMRGYLGTTEMDLGEKRIRERRVGARDASRARRARMRAMRRRAAMEGRG